MLRIPNIDSVSVIGGFAVAILLGLAGLGAARADELSDLYANQQLIQTRLNQLSRPQPQGGSRFGDSVAPDRPSVIGGSSPRSFSIPGTNTSVTISGSVGGSFGYGISR